MRRTPRSSTRCRLVLAALTLIALAGFAVTAAALPGVGGLAKKAKDKAAKAAGVKKEDEGGESEGAVTNDTVVFDDMTVELTPKRLDTIVNAYKASAKLMAERQPVVDQMNALNEEKSDFWQKESNTIMETQRKRDEVESCRHDAIREMTDAKMAEYSQTALTDPTIREKYTQIAMKYNAAAAKGDKAAIDAAQKEMLQVIMPSHADSVEATKKCPPEVPLLASEKKMNDYEKRLAALSDKVRRFDLQISESQGQNGMTQEQFAVASERIRAFRGWRASKNYKASATKGFTQVEIEAMEERLKDLEAAGI